MPNVWDSLRASAGIPTGDCKPTAEKVKAVVANAVEEAAGYRAAIGRQAEAAGVYTPGTSLEQSVASMDAAPVRQETVKAAVPAVDMERGTEVQEDGPDIGI